MPKVIVQLPYLSRPRAASFRKTAEMADGWSNTGRGCCIAKRRIQGWNPKCPVRFLRAQSWLVVIGRHWSYSDIFGHSTWVVISQVLIMCVSPLSHHMFHSIFLVTSFRKNLVCQWQGGWKQLWGLYPEKFPYFQPPPVKSWCSRRLGSSQDCGTS